MDLPLLSPKTSSRAISHDSDSDTVSPITRPGCNQDLSAPPSLRLILDSALYMSSHVKSVVDDTVDKSSAHSFDDENENEWIIESTDTYMLNAGEGSWSGTLDSHGYPERAQVEDGDHQPELPNANSSDKLETDTTSKNKSFAPGWTGLSPHEELMVKDMLLRNIIRKIKTELKNGALLVLHGRKGSDEESTCLYPFCLSTRRQVNEAHYHVQFWGRTHLKTSQQDRLDSLCLPCFEEIWSGKGMIPPFPEPSTSTLIGALKDDLMSVMFDTSREDDTAATPTPSPPREPIEDMMQQFPSLMHSRHAPKVGEDDSACLSSRGAADTARTSSNNVGVPGQESGSPVLSSPSSDEWRQIPTRFQYLAYHMVNGKSLSPQDKAILLLWKLASREQTTEETEHLKDSVKRAVHDLLRFHLGPQDEPINDMGKSDCTSDGRAESNRSNMAFSKIQNEISRYETVARLSKKDCRSKDLSTLLTLTQPSVHE